MTKSVSKPHRQKFTCENFDVIPDIVVIGKGLGGGVLPLAAIIAREYLDVAAERALGHYTHEKNPVSCAAALAAIDTIEKNGLADHARRLGNHTLQRLREMKQRHVLIGDVRGLGLFLGIKLVRDRQTRERAPEEAEAVMYAALSKGLSYQTHHGKYYNAHPGADHHQRADGFRPGYYRGMHRRGGRMHGSE